ncbi:MAG: SUMF1/EgtB/PvdO family nonheme iron enzyme [Chloroflexota bacterium]|nr:SUMF1/EgtB/PvdO family nonheme iron enzyme [Chloroflexota bacterium]
MAHLFISYSRKDFPIVDRLRNDLRDHGIDVWIDKVGLTPGTFSWEQALRDAIRNADAVLLCASTDSRESPYVRDEVALAKQAQKLIYPAWVAGEEWLDCIPLGLGGTQFADLRGEHYPTGLMQLIAAVRGEKTPVAPLVDENPSLAQPPAPEFVPRNPFKGLRAFRPEDKGDFFGRDALVAALLAQVENKRRPARLLAVLGASGSGKSSIMMAGLLPKLREKHADWLYLDPMVPGAQPLERLTILLARALKRAQSDIRKDLEDKSQRGLHRLACELSDKPVILYIDQFEEVFTLVSDEGERRQFIDLLSTAVNEPDGVLYVLLSMRADFYDRPLQFTPFGKLIETHHTAITPMTLADLYDVVQKPTQLSDVRLTFEEGLVTEMVFAVREETAALPLLQFTLDQLFERRAGQNLTLTAYRDLGGIQGALAKHADATYDRLPTDVHRDLARWLFLRLIEPGQTEQDTTRRRVTYDELTLPAAEQTRILHQTADAFVDARLLVGDQSGTARTLEVSHEALIREWGRLGEWLHEAREDLRLQKSLAADAAEWVRRGKPADMLYRGTVLADARAWAERNVANRDESLFLQESQQSETERLRRESAARRTLRFALGGLIGVIALAAVIVALTLARSNADLQAEAAMLQSTLTPIPPTLTAVGALLAEASTRSADAQSVAATAQFASTVSAFEGLRISTRVPGLGQLPPTANPTIEPMLAFVTATQIASTYGHEDDVIQTFEDGVEMVLVPAGCFFMGSSAFSDATPITEVCFDEPFWIDRFEVTQGQFERLDGEIASQFQFTGADRPVENITWFEAHDFCEQKRDARLPTEAEWEYAAAGPDSYPYPWGREFPENSEDFAVFNQRETGDVGVGIRDEGRSWVGAYDLSGNVSEWTSSLYLPYDSMEDREADTGTRTDVRRVLRGGSWGVNGTVNLRAANRGWGNPGYWGFVFGFRCARSS